ncbi:MAG: TRAP transporter large permease [Dehalococcoidia bacterium]|nr:TRAP transporter large permease [Dehalococcoidia bacterium]
MDPLIIGIVGCVILLILIFLGVHVAFALALIGFVGLVALRGWDGAFGLFRTVAYFRMSDYSLTPLPLFVFMASICLIGGITTSIYDSLAKWLSWFPASLGVSTAVASAVFGLLTGSSMVVAAMFTKLSIPEMLKHNYNRQFAAGITTGTSVLGMLIPPSLFAILYGILANESIGKLFAAGIVPGVITLVAFVAYITIRAKRNPELAPPSEEKYTMGDRVRSLSGVWPMLLIGIVMLAGIFSGLFTVTEGASIGLIGAIIVLLAMRKLSMDNFMASAVDTVKVNCMICILLISVTLFSRFIAMAGVTQSFADFLMTLNLSSKGILAMFLVLYLILGCFLDVIGMLAVTLPILLPLQTAFGWDPIYLGMVVIYACLMGSLTPPVGLTLFATKGAADFELPFTEIVWGTVPFVIIMAGIMALIFTFEPLAIGLAAFM